MLILVMLVVVPYVGGGPGSSKIDRIDYSNDTATASPKGPLISARSLSWGNR